MLTFAVAGCGSGGGDRQAVTATVTAYLRGLLDGDGAQVCSHLTPQLRAEQTAAVNTELGGPTVLGQATGGKTLSCAAAFTKLSSLIPAKERSKTIKVTQVKVTGDSATARIQGGTGTAHLVKRNGRWLLGSPPSATSSRS